MHGPTPQQGALTAPVMARGQGEGGGEGGGGMDRHCTRPHLSHVVGQIELGVLVSGVVLSYGCPGFPNKRVDGLTYRAQVVRGPGKECSRRHGPQLTGPMQQHETNNRY